MSVLNKMLQDLAQRQGTVASQPGIPAGVQISAAPLRSRLPSMLLLAAMFVLLVISGAVGYWLARAPAPPTRSTSASNGIQPRIVAAPPARVASAPVATAQAAPQASPVAAVATSTATAAARPAEAPVQAPSAAPASVASPRLPATAGKPAQQADAGSQPATVASGTDTAKNHTSKTGDAKASPRAAAADSADSKAVAAGPASVTLAPSRDYQFQQAQQAIQQGHQREGMAQLRQLLQETPRHQAARQLLAAALINEQQLAEAEAVLREGQQLHPADLEQAMALARLQLERGDMEAALSSLQTSLPHAARNGNYLAFKASLHQRRQEHAAAADLLGRALSTDPDTGKWLLALAVSQQALGQQQAARSSAEAALASGNLASELQDMARRLAGHAP